MPFIMRQPAKTCHKYFLSYRNTGSGKDLREAEARLFFSKGKSSILLVDMRGIKSTTKAAREYMATIGVTLVKACALITGSGFNRTLGNIFLTIDKPAVPTKLFTDEGKARAWLQQYLG